MAMEVEKIPRIGIAVKDLEKAKDFLINVFGAKTGIKFKGYDFVEDEIPSEGMKSCYLTLGGLQIELMSPTDEDGNIANFIKKKGEGLMSISFVVDDLNESIQYLESKGVRIVGKMLDHHTRFGDDKVHTPYCFMHPKDFFGIMVELATE
jgi:methylmalonyl-CoA/ethylmalonyl-CoA epimerase